MQRIGFIGVGIMGHGMAACLLKAGFPLTIIAHRNRRPVEDLIAKGAKEAATYEELAAGSDVIILCVSNSGVVEKVVADLKPFLRQGMTVIDTGTSRPASSKVIAADLALIEVAFADAPVTGGVMQAAAGELGALVGADEETYHSIKTILGAYCRTVHHFGPVGAGNTAKLINNFMVFGIGALVTEAFTRAEKSGVDWQKLYDVVICGSADSGVLRRIIGNAVKGDFKGYVFDVKSSLKDVRYFCELADEMDTVSDLGQAVRNVYETAVADGHGDRLLSELLAPDVRSR